MRPLHLLLSVGFAITTSAAVSGEKWLPGPPAKKVLGQPDFDSDTAAETQQGMDEPWDVDVDPTTGKVFVSDANNGRILRYASYTALVNHAPAEAVIGQKDFETTIGAAGIKGLFNPRGICVDHTGTLWVADFRNHRVVWYENASSIGNHPDADGVIGKPNFDDTDSGLTASRIGFPMDVVVDLNGNLFVCSSANDRVLMFPDAKANGSSASATLVLGQEGFEVAGENSDDDGFWACGGLELDTGGNLYVSDIGNDRVLRFDNAASKSNGDPADAVFGQTGLNVPNPGAGGGATGLNNPHGLAIDSSGTLWVADSENHRIVGYVNAAAVVAGPGATYLLGQDDFDGDMEALDQMSVDAPKGVGRDGAGRVYVADSENERVLIFTRTRYQPDVSIGSSIGKQKGGNVYNSSGAGQRQTTRSSRRSLTFKVIIGTDGDVTEASAVRSLKSSKKRKIKVFSLVAGRVNVTSAVRSGAHSTGLIAPGGALVYDLRVQPDRSLLSRRSSHRVWIEATSLETGTVDRAIGVFKRIP